MVTLAESLVSSSARPLQIRMRQDLTSKKQRYQGRVYWIVKEPIGLHYFRFQEEEFAILQMLDGRTSLDDIKRQFEDGFPPHKITVEEVARFIGNLHQSGLVVANVPGQGHQLNKRRGEKRKKELLGRLSSVLAIRFKGVDPERFLNWVYPKVRWFFTTPALVICLLICISALTLVVVQFDIFQSKLPTFQQFFARENWIFFALVLAVTKILHELGHGLSCKHFGGECHEIGVMILVLTPCLYCNVSDSWMLPNKWHRAAIGAAGMYIEVVLASICTFLWWFSEPGMFNQLCLSVMFVCSVSTIIFNGNPLLRYDGYYILSDIVEIPNLRQKATSILARKAGSLCLGLEEPDDPFLPQRNQWFFALYTVAAFLYRWFVVLAILFFLNKVFEPYGLQVLGRIIALAAMYGMIVVPLWKVFKYFRVPGRLHKVKKNRFYATLAVLGVIIAALFLIPLPHSVICPVEVQPHGAAAVYVDAPGTLKKIHVKPGQFVRKGDKLFELQSIAVVAEEAELEGQANRYQARLESLQRERHDNEEADEKIGAVRSTLATSEKQLAKKRQDVAKLIIYAPRDGYVLPPPPQPDRTPEGELPSWSGSPLQPHNEGALLAEGTLLCQVGDRHDLEAILIIDQGDIDMVRKPQRVEIKLDMLPFDTYESEIAQISNRDLRISSQRASIKTGGALETVTDETGQERPISTSYQARALLKDPNNENIFLVGMRGRAKVHTDWLPLGKRFTRMLSRVFNFDL